MGSAGERSKSRRDASRQAIAAANRTKWEAQNARSNELTGKQPTTNVYMASSFETKRYTLTEAVEALRESAQPDMYDCLQNSLLAKLTINMCTKKKTKFISKFDAHIVLPKRLDFLPKTRVIALCKDAQDSELCLAEGAMEAGVDELFSRLEHGVLHWEEYDTVVAHSNWETAIGKLRHLLKERLPTVKNGRIGEDVTELVRIFSNGTNITSFSLEGVPEIAFINLVIGQLSWDVESLEMNLRSYFETIELNKSSRAADDMILSVELSCPPTGERFLLDHSPLLPQSESKLVASSAS